MIEFDLRGEEMFSRPNRDKAFASSKYIIKRSKTFKNIISKLPFLKFFQNYQIEFQISGIFVRIISYAASDLVGSKQAVLFLLWMRNEHKSQLF